MTGGGINWPPGITSQIAYDFYLQDRLTCACGHFGGVHGRAPEGVPHPRLGKGECDLCECDAFATPN